MIDNPIGSWSSLVDLLMRRAEEQPERVAFTFLGDHNNEEQRVTYGELDRGARSIAALLQQSTPPGARVLLLYPPGLEYVTAFFGCLYANLVAVPAYPPDPSRLNRSLPRLQAIVDDATPQVALTTSMVLSFAEIVFGLAPILKRLRWYATDTSELASGASSWNPPHIDSGAVAFLQYTSGSTSSPKGVMVTHANLLHNLSLIHRFFRIGATGRGVSWLPLYHDMGLIGCVLEVLYMGGDSILLSPITFLKNPVRWLEAISRFRATISGGPNFGYDLCVRKTTPEQRATLDLSSWETAFCGAEQIRPETIDSFCYAFAPSGFRKTAFYPCYGLAEATLIVSGGVQGTEPVVEAFDRASLEARRVQPPTSGQAKTHLVSCGRSSPDQRIAVVDEQAKTCPHDAVGEIWVSGPSVANGYWGRSGETNKVFSAYLEGEPSVRFMRTGDLGFIRNDEVFIVGRGKDVIIVRGRNIYPEDIELVAEKSHPSVRRGCCAAFSINGADGEQIVLAIEVERRHRPDRRVEPAASIANDMRRASDRRVEVPDPGGQPDQPVEAAPAEIVRNITEAVAAQHDVALHEVVLLQAGSIPKTSSGKIQRHACRAAYCDNTLRKMGEP